MPVYVYAVAFFAIIGVNLLQKRVEKERKFLKYLEKAQQTIANQVREQMEERESVS